jgi:predicted nucleotidyltransferase
VSERDDIVRRARAVFGTGLLGMLAFGSRVGGNPRAESDLDLLVWLESPIRRRTSWLPWVREFGEDEPVLDPTFVTEASLDAPSSWLLEAVRSGVDVWYDPSGRLARSVDAIRAAIDGGAYRRRLFMGLPYYAKEGA